MTDTTQQQYHYFASCALAWATADTREEAIRKCIRHAGTDTVKQTTLNLHKAGQTGFYIFSLRVDVPSDADYKIEYYAPRGVPVSEVIDHDVTYVTTKELAYTSDPREENEES